MDKITKRRKTSLRRLTGALKELLDADKNDDKAPSENGESLPQSENGLVYIMSKEHMLIPKLSDEEVLERHKRADENMKQVWTRIIEKYENLKDQGDIVDLQTGEIIEDNGHLRNLDTGSSRKPDPELNGTIQYQSILNDIIDIKDYDKSVWEEEEQSSGSESDLEEEDYTEEREQDESIERASAAAAD